MSEAAPEGADGDTPDIETGRWLFAQPCTFLRGVVEMKGLPATALSEVAFAGRSNVGKSSLINALTGRKTLARTSNTPGRTKELNFFELGPQGQAAVMLVDLPGYGYAKVAVDLRKHWQGLIQGYLESRNALAGLIQVMDIRHPLKDGDIQLAEFALHRGLPIHVVLTKADKLGHGKRMEAVRRVRDALGGVATVQVFSATTGLGLEDLEHVLAAWFRVESA